MKKLKFLILEDYFALRRELVELVQSIGHTAIEVPDTAAAFKVLRTERFDALILDAYIKKGKVFDKQGGFSLIATVRRRLSPDLLISSDTPILAMSGGAEIQGGFSPLRTARDLGADLCIKKPFDLREVAAWIFELEATMPGDETQEHP